MRKVIFTENQLKHILGENFDSYLPKSGYASENPENSYGTEVTVSDNGSNGDPMDTCTTDKIAKSRTPSISLFRRISESKKKVNEENQELMSHQYNLGKGINNQIDALAAQNPNDKLLQNMSNNKNMEHSTAKKRKHDLEAMKKENPERYASINGDKLLKSINGKLETDRNISKSHKEFKRDVLGYTNAFQKEGGTKNNASPTTNNNVTFSYEN